MPYALLPEKTVFDADMRSVSLAKREYMTFEGKRFYPNGNHIIRTCFTLYTQETDPAEQTLKPAADFIAELTAFGVAENAAAQHYALLKAHQPEN